LDVSARDQMFEQLFEHSSDPVFVVDPLENRMLDVNHAACAMLGYTRDELLATPISAIHPAEMPQLRDFVESVVRVGHGWTIKLTCRTKTGTFLPTEMALLALDSGGRVYVFALVHDRSEHRQRNPDG
jgi:PAS domain S-box-containing protein